MKKVAFPYIGVILFFLLISAGSAQAVPFEITDSSGEEKAIFGFNEIPWLNIELKKQDNDILGWWKSVPGGNKNVIFESGLIGNDIVRRPLSDWDWPQPQDLGKYNIHLNGSGTRHITVTPEPVSSVLFLVGAASLAAVGLRRKKE